MQEKTFEKQKYDICALILFFFFAEYAFIVQHTTHKDTHTRDTALESLELYSVTMWVMIGVLR